LRPILAPLAFSKRTVLRGVAPRGLWFAFIGGTVTCLGNIAYYAALSRGERVATVASLTALYPVVTILLAILVLRERLNRVQSFGLVLALIAIWLFNIQPGGSFLSRTVVFAVLPIVFWGLSGFLQKLATNHLSGETASLLYLGAFVPVGVFFALTEPWPSSLTPRHWALVLALGFFLAFGNLAILAAFAAGGKAAVIAPLGSLYPAVSVPLAVVLLRERVEPREILAIAVALTSVAALSFERGQPPARSARLVAPPPERSL
jgi:drug/metabolite transporter (DMT)-like permease